MYMQHKHMVYGELHIHHYLVLDQNANDNAYSTPLRNEFWNVDHKELMLGIDFCYNKFSHLGVNHQNYPEHDTPLTVCCFCPDQKHHFCGALMFESVEIP